MPTFDKTQPPERGRVLSAPLRQNFLALATLQAGSTEPSAPEKGYLWLDTTDLTNYKLKIHNGTAWVTLFEHVESAPTGGKNEYAGTRDPAPSDDASQGYGYGSEWYYVATSRFYKCVSPSVGSAVWIYLGGGEGDGSVPTPANKNMAAQATSGDFQVACNIPISYTPASDGYVEVCVNGVAIVVGDGVRTSFCYFSDDGGITARLIADIEVGDKLYWVGSVAGFQLTAQDRIDFLYNVTP